MIPLPKRAKSNIDAQINIVPYIDVMLVLLVIFMMTTPIIEQGVEVDLPSADAKMVEFSEHKPTVISINKDGKYFISSLTDDDVSPSEPLPLETIAGRVNARMQLNPQTKVFIRSDESVRYGLVVHLMSFLEKNGVEKAGLLTQSPNVQ